MNIKSKNKVHRIFYGTNENQFGDLRIPHGEGPFPMVMIIHGGFWREKFDLEQMNKLADAFTENGIATWNIEYCRVGQENGGWPGTFLDCAKAADYIQVLAETYPIDVNRVIPVGHSAGGHLALWLSGRHKLPLDSELRDTEQPFPFRGVISLAGVSDLEVMHDIHQWTETLFGIVENPTRDFLRGKPNKEKVRYEEGSPSSLLPLGIPIVLIHGKLDVNVPVGLSEHFLDLATKAGDTITMKSIPDAEHFKLIVPESASWPVVLNEVKALL